MGDRGRGNDSIHSDHANAAVLTEQARFYAGPPTGHDLLRHGVSRFVAPKTGRDRDNIEPSMYVPISEQTFDVWRDAIPAHAFAPGETYGFTYIDHYSGLMAAKGAPARAKRACAFAEKVSHAVVEEW